MVLTIAQKNGIRLNYQLLIQAALLSLLLLFAINSTAQQAGSELRQQNISALTNPLDVVKLIGDKLIRDTPFAYRLVRGPINHTFNDLQFVDFGRAFGVGKPAVAYAFTNLSVTDDQEFTIQTEHNDGCKIWLNGQLVYVKRGDHTIRLAHEERSIELPNTLKLALRKGNNELLIKSETQGKEWRVYLQPPSEKGAILPTTNPYPQLGLANVTNVDTAINSLTNWLIIGPFDNPITNDQRTGIDTPYTPEAERQFGVMYPGLGGPVTWTIPKIDILGDLINPQPWGTNYHWNYHNGGTAWAMQQLAELTHETKYDDYASNFCDFHLKSAPFVRYQVGALNAVNSANNHLIDTPLLDFTLAPSLPFIYRLRQTRSFSHRDDYAQFIEKMMKYAQHEQIRLPGSRIYTRVTPEIYTTWADDMFMGIPFLVQAALYTPDPARKKIFLDDAANQLIGFTNQVWDSTANLYMHARYSARAVKLPHWSRANGWATWAMTEVLMNLPKTHPQYKPILAQYQKHIAALVKLQDASGFWLNVLDRSDSPKEVSGTAIFTMAIARGVRYGWLNAKTYKRIAQKGWEALKTAIEPDGTVHRICMGTMCSEDVNYYINRPYYDNDTHGLFAVLFAGLSMYQMP
ncbi:hypothetical protein GO755_24240 [Spirosoma sp. HMF4905]|uniref:Glycoside hydrolase n=2 Tax=Spirosoma arboris TaxID=2682092 RepID=A0A7K1SH86_9BACT|nr:hypothetical protein [Spirosoma arboris]